MDKCLCDFGGQNAQSPENRPCDSDWISRFEAQGMGILQRMLKYSHAKVCPLLGRTLPPRLSEFKHDVLPYDFNTAARRVTGQRKRLDTMDNV